MCDLNKMVGVKLRFKMSIKLALNVFLLQLLRCGVVEISLWIYSNNNLFNLEQ